MTTDNKGLESWDTFRHNRYDAPVPRTLVIQHAKYGWVWIQRLDHNLTRSTCFRILVAESEREALASQIYVTEELLLSNANSVEDILEFALERADVTDIVP